MDERRERVTLSTPLIQPEEAATKATSVARESTRSCRLHLQFKRQFEKMRSIRDIHQLAIDDGMVDFRRAALLKISRGETSFDEMNRILTSMDELDVEGD